MRLFVATFAVFACALAFGGVAAADHGATNGPIELYDRVFKCGNYPQPLHLSLLKVTLGANYDGSQGHTAAFLTKGSVADECTGTIERIEVDTQWGDAVKALGATHDLTINGGYLRCWDKQPVVHQDGVQAPSAKRVTFNGLVVYCPSSNHSSFFIGLGAPSDNPAEDVKCVSCSLKGGGTTVHFGDSWRSEVSNSTVFFHLFALRANNSPEDGVARDYVYTGNIQIPSTAADYVRECHDGLDNDGDGKIDYASRPSGGIVAQRQDLGCADWNDHTENTDAPPANVQFGSGTGTSTSPSASFSAAPVVGNLLVAHFAWNNVGSPIFTCPVGWTALDNVTPGGNVAQARCTKTAGVGESLTVTGLLSASKSWVAFVSEYSHVGSLDRLASATGDSRNPTSGLVTAGSGKVYIAGISNKNTDAQTSPTSGFLKRSSLTSGTGSGGLHSGFYEKIVTTPEDAQVTVTIGVSRPFAGALATYNSAS